MKTHKDRKIATRFTKHPSLDRLLHGTEHVVNKASPFVMVVLGVLIVGEFTIGLHQFEPWVSVLDMWIIAFFVLDLAFKWVHTKGVLTFVKLYWIEILCVFPFYFVLRVFTEFGFLGEAATTAQKITHEAALAREAEIIGKESAVLREARLLREAGIVSEEAPLFARIVRFVQRSFRLVMARIELTYKAFVDHSHSH